MRGSGRGSDGPVRITRVTCPVTRLPGFQPGYPVTRFSLVADPVTRLPGYPVTRCPTLLDFIQKYSLVVLVKDVGLVRDPLTMRLGGARSGEG